MVDDVDSRLVFLFSSRFAIEAAVRLVLSRYVDFESTRVKLLFFFVGLSVKPLELFLAIGFLMMIFISSSVGAGVTNV